MSTDNPDSEGASRPTQTLGPRLRAPWLILMLVVAVGFGVLRGEGPIADAWLLPASGAAITLFMVLLGKSLDLLSPSARGQRP